MDTPFAAYHGDQPYVFVCYAHKDMDAVYPEMNWLREQGINIWYDEGISGGRVWRAEIGTALKRATKVFFYVSSASLASDHCSREINFALDEALEVVPIYLEDVALTMDLKLGLGRVQALLRFDDPRYRHHLLAAAGAHQVAAEVPVELLKTRPGRSFWPGLVGLAALLAVAAALWVLNPWQDREASARVVRLGITPFQPVSKAPVGLEFELERRLSASDGLIVRVESAARENEDYRVSGTLFGTALRLQLHDRNGVDVATWTTSLDSDLSAVADSISRILLLKLGRSTEVVSRFQEAIEPQVFRVFLGAVALLRSSHTLDTLKSAETAFKSVLAVQSRYAPAHAGLCSTYLYMYQQSLEEDKFQRAEQHCHRALTLDEQNSAVHMALGMLYRETGQTPKAIDSFHRALSLAPYFTDAMRGLAETLDRSGATADAEHWYREAIRVEPSHWENYQALGIHQFSRGDFKAAIENFQTAVTLAPDELGPINNIGAAYFMSGDYEEAVTYWRQVAERQPGPRVYANLAASYFYQQQFDQARSMYESAHAVAPEDYRYPGHIGEVVNITEPTAAQPYFQQAIELGRKLLDIDPDNSLTLSNLASYHAGLGNNEQAEVLLGRALKLDADNVDVVYNAAICYTRLGATELALAQLERLAALGYAESLLALDANFYGLYSKR